MEHKVESRKKTKIFPLKILPVGFLILLFFTIAFMGPSQAQRTDKIKPKTPSSENKRQVTKQPTKKVAPKRSLVPSGKQADITIFATGNVLGYIEPCG